MKRADESEQHQKTCVNFQVEDPEVLLLFLIEFFANQPVHLNIELSSILLFIIYRWAIAAKEISDLWMEYEENSSLEAKVVKDFDKVLYVTKV